MLFTKHATKRTSERTGLSNDQIISYIGKGMALNLGSKPGINKYHWLLYSTKDSAYFVAIQDSLNGAFITFLPLEYHDNLAWPITVEQKELVFKIAHTNNFIGDQEISKVIRVKVLFDFDGLPKTKVIKKLEAAQFANCIPLAVEFIKTNIDVIELAATYNITRNSIFAVSVSMGKTHQAVLLPISDFASSEINETPIVINM